MRKGIDEAMMNEEAIESVLSRIDGEELGRLALTLGNIDSPSGSEKPVAEFLVE